MSGPEYLLRFGRRIARVQDQWLEAAAPLAALREGFLVRAGAVRGAARRQRSGLLLVAALALAIAGYAGARDLLAPAPLSVRVRNAPALAETWVRSESSERVPIEFSDGSRMQLEPDSRARIAELRPDGATLAIESGGIDVAVVHRERTNYRLSFGPFAVRVTGTRFSVSWRPDQDAFQLRLREGSVIVSGCALGDPRPLRAGEVLTASCRDARFEISRGQAAMAPAPAAAQPGSRADAAPSDLGALPRARQAARPVPEAEWRELGRAGEYRKALESLSAAEFEAACETGGSADLTLLADVARFGGSPDRALSALGALRRRFPGSSRASAAAFTIARIHFDQRAAYDEAARWFRSYLTEQPRGALAREAQGRLMEALYRAGDREGARRAAEQYLSLNPAGPHARLARTLQSR